MNQPKKNQLLYRCPDHIVEVIVKTKNLNRSPQHNFPCVLFILSPRRGTRVRCIRGGKIEFMPKWGELRALLAAIAPELERILPKSLCDKPIEVKRYYDRRNAKRHGER